MELVKDLFSKLQNTVCSSGSNMPEIEFVTDDDVFLEFFGTRLATQEETEDMWNEVGQRLAERESGERDQYTSIMFDSDSASDHFE